MLGDIDGDGIDDKNDISLKHILWQTLTISVLSIGTIPTTIMMVSSIRTTLKISSQTHRQMIMRTEIQTTTVSQTALMMILTIP